MAERFVAAVVLVLPLSMATAQSGQRTVVRSAYRPGIDVLDYDFHLELPDTGAYLRGDVTVTLRRAPAARVLRLDLVDRLTVRAVTVDGRDVAATHAGGALDIPLDDAAGDSVRVRVGYDGVVTDGLIAQKDNRGRWTWFGDNWPDRARQWLPTVDHPSDKATVGFTVRAPSSLTIVSNGTLLGVERLGGADAGRSETRWRESRPIATYLMVIGAGPLARTPLPDAGCVRSAAHRCVEQSAYVLSEHTSWMPGAFAAAPAIVSYYEELVGPFPYEKLAHLQSATRFGGMENATAIFYADNLFTEHRLGEGIIAHETAHQWFGDAVTEREWGHLWLSEGFATYFAALWTRHSRGESAFRKEMAEIRQKILDDSIVATRPVLDTAQRNYLLLLNRNSYEKGGYVLYMLNTRLGDSAFFAGLRSYYATYRDQNVGSDDLRRELERASGQSLGQYFDQWLRRPGVPEPAIGWAYDASSETVSLIVLQEGAGGGGAYELPLTVAVTDATGATRRVEVRVPAVRRATIALPGRFPSKPSALRFDPDTLLLARVVTL